MVWGADQPALNASVSRTLVITPPCAAGLYACPASTAGRVLCSGIPCALLASLLPQQGPVVRFVQQAPAGPPPPPSGPQPALQQQQQQQIVVMSYGQPPGRSLLPCASAADAGGGGCRAVAYDASVSSAAGPLFSAAAAALGRGRVGTQVPAMAGLSVPPLIGLSVPCIHEAS